MPLYLSIYLSIYLSYFTFLPLSVAYFVSPASRRQEPFRWTSAAYAQVDSVQKRPKRTYARQMKDSTAIRDRLEITMLYMLHVTHVTFVIGADARIVVFLPNRVEKPLAFRSGRDPRDAETVRGSESIG